MTRESSVRRRIAIALPALLLLIVAGAQMTLARTTLLSPWKGGGFGMFASVDGLPFRWVRLYVSAPDRSEELAVPPSLEDRAHRVATWPRQRAMEDLADAVLAREQRHNRPIESVRVEVWRADVSASLDVVERLVREVMVSMHEGDASSDR